MISRPPILPSALGLLMMLVIFSLHFLKPIAVWLPYPLNYIGLLPIFVGVLLNLLADRELRMKGVIDASGEYNPNSRILVTSGIFQFSRNPGYLGTMFIGVGLAMWVGSLSPWIVVLGSPLVIYHGVIRIEEDELRSRFGRRYVQYCQIVPRWIGRPGCRVK